MGVDKKIKKFLKDSIRVAPKISSKGELFELRNGLVSPYPQTRKDAIRKIIQQMTSGKDVSSLFPDVMKNIATQDIEQKKLVYLYMSNYAESHPELCILVVNTFVCDASDPNPLIRAMAIRTMSMIRVDKILEYIEIPLRKTLQDDNPYVRKTAVLCVAKLFELDKQLCIELGVLEDLKSALMDDNPMVVANALAALNQIREIDSEIIDMRKLLSSNVKRFLNVLNECTEWARITILEALAGHKSIDSMESQEIIDRVIPHLQHVNPSVVLASVKCILMHFSNLNDVNDSIYNKISTALVSLMSTPPEIQYVALRNIRIILDAFPSLLKKELRIFYIKFNDPLYVKMEKLDILIRLVSVDNLKQCQLLLNELKEYIMEFDHEFVTKAIQSISQLAIKVSEAGHDTKNIFINKAIDTFIDLLQGREDFNDILTTCICDLLRHDKKMILIQDSYKVQFKAIASSWQKNIDSLFSSDIGYCNYIWYMSTFVPETTETILNALIPNFHEHGSLTQMAILMAVVKCNQIIPGSLLQKILELCTSSVDDLDIRDMAMIYWRCLSIENGEQVINQLFDEHEVPQLHSTLDHFSKETLQLLLQELSTLSSVYYKPFKQLTRRQNHINVIRDKDIDELKGIAANEILRNLNDDVLLDLDNESPIDKPIAVLNELTDLFDITTDISKLNLENNQQIQTTSQTNHTNDLLDLF